MHEDSAAFLLGEAMQYLYSGALRAAAHIGIADHLVAGPRSAEELAELTGTHPGPVRRVLRLLATRGVFHEDPDGRFQLSPHAQALLTDSPTSVREAMVFITEPWLWQPAGDIAAAVRTGTPSADRILGKPTFDYLAGNPDLGADFHSGMAQYSRLESKGFAEVYQFPTSGVLVDVGGGRGQLLIEVLRRNPGLRGVLFDQPGALADHQLAALGQDDRWEVVPGDFFEEIPSGGDVYSMQYILHDWDDDSCVRILRNIRRAMSPTAKAVVLDTVLPTANESHPGKSLDLIMLASFTGKERTEAEFTTILDKAGMRLTRIIEKPKPCWLSIIEAAPR